MCCIYLSLEGRRKQINMNSLTNLSAPNPSNTTMVYAPSSEFSRADEILVRNNVQQIRKYLSFHEEYLLRDYCTIKTKQDR